MRRGLVCRALLASYLSLAGCATTGGVKTGDARDHGTLTREQIAENHFNTAYDAVEALRSNWLTVRGGADSFQTPSEVLVYMDDVRLGNTDKLREVAASNIYYMRYLDGVAATGRWGVGHSAGVIYISTRPPGADPASPPNGKDTLGIGPDRGASDLVQ